LQAIKKELSSKITNVVKIELGKIDIEEL